MVSAYGGSERNWASTFGSIGHQVGLGKLIKRDFFHFYRTYLSRGLSRRRMPDFDRSASPAREPERSNDEVIPFGTIQSIECHRWGCLHVVRLASGVEVEWWGGDERGDRGWFARVRPGAASTGFGAGTCPDGPPRRLKVVYLYVNNAI